MAEILRAGDAGPLIGIHHHWMAPGYGPDQTRESNWRNRLEHSGGQLIFHCCHVLDWMRWVGGEVKAITASSYTPPDIRLPHEERELTACMEFARGGMAVFNLSQESHQYNQFGSVHAANVGLSYAWGPSTFVKEYRKRPRAADRTHEWSLNPSIPGDGSDPERTALQMKNFIDAYQAGEPMPCTLADGVRAYDMAVAIRESYCTGQRVELPEPPTV
jgi:predicted dehydrogenase